MIIGIDGNEANVQRKVGISEYAYQLLCEFARYQMEDLHFEVYLKHPPRAEMPSPTPFFFLPSIRTEKTMDTVCLTYSTNV